MSLLQSLLLNQLLTFLLVLTRVSGLIMTAPIYGSQSIPMRIRAFFAVAIAILITPSIAAGAGGYPETLLDLMIEVSGELLLGLTLGLGIHILFTGVQLAGQIIGQLSGMALADVFDPNFNNNSPVFSQVLFYVTLGVFVLVDGHRLVMGALLDTFTEIPPGTGMAAASVVEALVEILAQSFVLGIRAAAPVMTALLLSTLVMGLVSRTLPQLNILAFGFGLNALIVQSALFFSLGGVAWVFQDEFGSALDLLNNALLAGTLHAAPT